MSLFDYITATFNCQNTALVQRYPCCSHKQFNIFLTSSEIPWLFHNSPDLYNSLSFHEFWG